MLLAFVLSGCQQFFTTSLASGLARTSLNIPSNLSVSDATSLAAQAKANNDTKLATALVSSLETEIASTTDPNTKSSLEASAASAAIVASGVSSTLTSLISTYENGGTASASTLISIVQTIKSSTTPSMIQALSYLDTSTLSSTSSSVQTAGLGATDYAVAAVVIAASVIPPNTNPETFNYASLDAADTAKVNTAENILTTASSPSMVTAGSSGAQLISQLKQEFSLSTS
jgi:hypothetical protein